MRIRTLGRSGLRISELCLGTMTFGTPEWGCDETESLRIVDRYLEAGGNFLDTADAYAAIAPEYPNAFIDVIQGWLGNR